MRSSYQSWSEYLARGVRLMEGTETTHDGTRRLPDANRIFEACAAQTDDEAVHVLGHFRRLQSALYQSDRASAEEWLKRARRAYELAGESQDITPQCLVIEGSALIHFGKYREAEDILRRAQAQAQQGSDHKLRGDTANMLGRLYQQHWDLTRGENPDRVAADWFARAVEEFSSVPEPDANTHHALATASGHAGISLQDAEGYASPAAQKMFKQTERLFAQEVCDPCVRTTFWIRRGKVAVRHWRIHQAVVFFLKAFIPAFACMRQLRRR